jgi:hypothetical protein
MLLTPVLRFIKLDMGPVIGTGSGPDQISASVSVIPLLYLAPIVFAFPFAIFFLWENDILSVPYIDDRLGDFVQVSLSLRLKGLFSILLTSCVLWGAALDSSGVLLP